MDQEDGTAGEKGKEQQEEQCPAAMTKRPGSQLLDPPAKRSRFFPISPATLPPDLLTVDFTQRVSWKKFAPYKKDKSLPLTDLGTAPTFQSSSPALCFHVHALCGRARAATLHLRSQHQQRPVPTPMFMPVGTKGCLKAVSLAELVDDLRCPIILGNTYHLAIQPGTELIDNMGGLHAFQGLEKHNISNVSITDKSRPPYYNLLTDSGGFQMVSLAKLSEVTEEGVSFLNPFKRQQTEQPKVLENGKDAEERQHSTYHDQSNTQDTPSTKDWMLLRPEDSIRHQNNIGANIIMALDDVVSSVVEDSSRFLLATHRTLRWYDRCVAAHTKADRQNLFPIVQGGLDTDLGGLREQCLAGFRHRELERNFIVPGYAIGGLAGGEAKDSFWKVVDQCCRSLPDDKPRYLMGVGYPLDLVVCTALGVDMYDCVYPTRTARFGVALIESGTLRLKANASLADTCVIQEGCLCQACRMGVSRSRLHKLLKIGNPLAAQLLTQHNIAYMMSFVRDMRQAILDNVFPAFVKSFLQNHFPKNDVPSWVLDALASAGIEMIE